MDSRNDNTIQVKLGGRTVDVPVYKDKDSTLTLVKKVNDRLKDIEAKSVRIDTQAYALEAALSFAMEAMQHDDEKQENTRDLLVELDALEKELTRLIQEHSIDTSQ